MAVVNSPFESQYGFKGPGFSVDEFGNITANSIITNVVDETSDFVDFTITETSGEFAFEEFVGTNPAITIARNSSYKFGLELTDLTFNIFSELPSTLYNTGLTHSDGSSSAQAQEKTSGTLTINVALDAPDTLYYANEIGTVFGTINVVDPVGQFSTLEVNDLVNATSSTTGALRVSGGASVEKDLYVGGELNLSGVGIPRLSSLTNLELNAANKVVFQIDNIKLGELNSDGLSLTINNSTIDNSTIGATSPSTATFTTATVETTPTANLNVTNKQYVDSTALSLAIAFGL